MEKFMKLKEHKSFTYHYFKDDEFKLQGEYKRYYHSNGQLWLHSYYKDDKRHGECKAYNEDGSLIFKRYYSNGNDITGMYLKLKAWKSL